MTTPSDQLQALRAKAQELRTLQLTIADTEERLDQMRSQLKQLQFTTLPDMMDVVGVDHIGLPAQDNLPACDLVLSPYYRANVAASWTEERRTRAFAALTEANAGDLIATEIKLTLPRGQPGLTQKVLSTLVTKFGLTAIAYQAVHHGTLTAWVREQFESHRPLPPLDLIGASIGRIAELKEWRSP